MAKIIALENTKGGSGKSTVATNLARGLQLAGHRVLIIDRDPLRISRQWRELADNEDYPLVVGIDTPTIHKEIKTIAGSFDYIVIDGAAVVEEMALSAIKAADLVLVPVQPSAADIWGAKPLLKLIRARQEITEGHPIARFIVTRAKPRTRLARQIHELFEQGWAALQTRITENVLYTECLTGGSSVCDAKGKRAEGVRNEINNLIIEIKELLK